MLRVSWAATDLRRREFEAQTLKKGNDDHRAIVSAVEVGDADAAARHMRRHLAMLRKTYVRLWTRHGESPLVGLRDGVGD